MTTSTASARRATGLERAARIWRDVGWRYVFMAPMLVLFAAFTLWPLVASIGYALYDWPGYGPVEPFVGAANFVEALGDPLFWSAAGNTGVFIGFAVVVQMPLALLLAVVVNDRWLKGRSVFRVLLFLPVVTTTAVVGSIVSAILSPSGGPVNDLLLGLGLVDAPVQFLASERTALLTLLIVDLWKGIGVTVIYWLAALQTIGAELYEAAEVDGASGRRQFLHITVPLLAPFAVVILLLTVSSSMNVFDLVQVMTQGGPNGATDIVQTYIYRYAFNPAGTPRFGYAAAVGLIFGVAVMIVTAVGRLVRRRPGQAVG